MAVCMVGCSASTEQHAEPKVLIPEYETKSSPALYRGDADKTKTSPEHVTEEAKPVSESDKQEEMVWVERIVSVMGYKVQVYSTTDLDDAMRKREALSLLLDSATVDMVFNAPYYKLRIGNCIAKSDADTLKASLQSKGIMDAWIVRDKVLQTLRKRVEKN